MRIHTEKIGKYLFFLLIFAQVVFLFYIYNRNHHDISFDNEPLITLNKNWTFTDDTGRDSIITLPSKVESGKDQKIILSNVLPLSTPNNGVLATFSSHQSIRAYIDNKLIYTCDVDKDGIINLSPGSMWNILKLPKESAGKRITLEIILDHNNILETINDIYIGSKASMLIHILKTRGLSMLISLIILFIGMNLIVAYISLKNSSNKSALYLGLFSVTISIWMIMESDMTQFFMQNRYLASTLKYLSLMTFPIPMLLYLSTVKKYRFRKLMLPFSYVFILNELVLLVLQVFNIVNLHNGLIVLHILMFLVFSFIFYTLCLEVFWYKNKDIIYLTISYGILFTFSVIELFYYNFKLKMNTGSFLQFGLLIFMLILSWRALQMAIDIVRLSQDAKYYEYLATMDYMTKCKNRTAYSKEMDLIDISQNVAVIMADINNMKYINDNFGHQAGDDIIIKCSQMLLDILETDDCYRIGGDEFVCIVYNQPKESLEKQLQFFMKECEQFNITNPYVLEVSLGYAYYDKNLDETIYDTVRRADKSMYRKKDKRKF